jgi:signal transduction histidine kinase/putative methionine-R-sulfoxide reductase with GAF domain
MTPRWRLFPKYTAIIIAVVGSLLVASGVISTWFSYRETEAHLVALQVEKAEAAATRIQEFVQGIEHQLSWTALPRVDTGGDALEQRRIEYLKLLRQAPIITEVVWIDPQGREQLRVSRLAMDAVGAGTDLSREPKFREAIGGRVYWGPVYFRKDTEPYMTIARPAGSGGGVTAAEVNLKFVWEVVSRIKVGEHGLAYVVDRSGTLIAHPDISLVLKKSDLSGLPQVKALQAAAGASSVPGGAATSGSALGRDLRGQEVFTAHAPIPTLQWTVFVESPREEALAPLYATMARAAILLAAGLVLSVLASFFVARALVRPLRALQEGAERVGAGELDRRIEVHTGDELEGVADRFNAMAGALRESYSNLERKVDVRTAELSEALEQQTAMAEILKVISGSVSNAKPVFDAILASCERLFGDRRVAITVVGDDGLVHLGAYHGPQAEEFGAIFPLPLTSDSATGSAILGRSVLQYPDVFAHGVPEPLRRAAAAIGTRSMVIAPLLWQDRGIGALMRGRSEPGEFSEKDVALMKTFADQAVIAIQNARLFNETKEALERQTATAEILQVISGSVADSRPVFEKILESCAHLFSSSEQGIVLAGEDGRVHLGAHRGAARPKLEPLFPAARLPGATEASFERNVLHYRDVLADPEVPSGIRGVAERIGIGTYSQVFVPMLWDGRPIGSLYVIRQPPSGFADKEIELLRTFADQAVIAIQNARLFRETREALDRQTATSDVLRVISESPTDVQPVFDAIASSGVRLFKGAAVAVSRPEAGEVRCVAIAEDDPARAAAWRAVFPFPLDPSYIHGAAMLECRVVDVPDVLATGGQFDAGKRNLAPAGYRAMTVVPMVREQLAIGAIAVVRVEPGPLAADQIALLQTFADQAVIAIENVRLFNETREALEQQTATAEILQVISRSVADSQPVFEAILRSCERLFNGAHMAITLLGDDGRVHLRAQQGPVSQGQDFARIFPLALSPDSGSGAAVLAREVMAYEDVFQQHVPYMVRRGAEAAGTRSTIYAPLLWEGRAIGAIVVSRRLSGAFSSKDVALIRTFADQAVIAIQNARLFNETREALERQTAIADILSVISSSPTDTGPVFEAIVQSCQRLFGGLFVAFARPRDGYLHVVAHADDGSARGRAGGALPPWPLDRGSGAGTCILDARVVNVADTEAATAEFPRMRDLALRLGYRSGLFVPLLRDERAIGAIVILRAGAGEFNEREVNLARAFADQAVIAIENVRLFNEIEEKGRQLELANKHKSEFLANMSHELRTPLNAIIGFSEVLAERMFGEVNDKQLEYLQDIHTSGHHLLTLINDILDLSKIEAGRMELELASVNLPMLLDNCTTLVRERASRQGLTLTLDVEQGVGDWVADVRKLKQIVINLLSNAVKFTPAGGRVTLRARRIDEQVEIAVIDTGVGIPLDQQDLVFEEFRQAGGDYLRKAEGTGLGLTLVKRFVELHGGSIRVESAPGHGSTFAFVLPAREPVEPAALQA